jgi:hypothetical protein
MLHLSAVETVAVPPTAPILLKNVQEAAAVVASGVIVDPLEVVHVPAELVILAQAA